MRKLIISLVGLVGLIGSLHAELLIFKETEVLTIFAGPGQGKATVRGNFAYDTVSGTMSEIGITSLPNGARHYIINTNFGEHVITRIPGFPQQLLVISRVSSSNTLSGLHMSTAFVKGLIYSLPTGTGDPVDFARALKGITRGITTFQGAPAYGESTITMSFSLSETRKANLAGESVAAFLERWRMEYERRGYTPVPGQ